MQLIKTEEIENQIAKKVQEVNFELPEDVEKAIRAAHDKENSKVGRKILKQILDNSEIAKNERVPLCQDTGLVVVYARVGQNLKFDGSLEEAINKGVSKGYKDGYLRKSVVKDPLDRENTGTNTPVIIHYDLVEGSELKLDIATKGGGSENMSQIKMMKPTVSRADIIDYIVQVVKESGANACPPLIVGVGIGGNFEKSALLAKESLFERIDKVNPDPKLKKLESDLLEQVNQLGIGPQGLGGNTTGLGVNIKSYPCHIASMPVAVNLNCHSARHISLVFNREGR
ncbi:MAG: fumarate hydratase [Halarsenatibacteraceae bacterium]